MKVGIVGLGLIGGSLGLDLRSRQIHTVGVSRRQQTCELAQQRGAVDVASVDPAILATVDIIFVCTPLSAIAPAIRAIAPHLKADTIVTDVGSVKQSIVESCTPLWPNFIGSHPMAGTAEQGIEAAQRDLFAGAPYVLTPTAATPSRALEMVSEIAQWLNAKVYTSTPAQHDRAVALISHLPIFVSASLLQTCMSSDEDATITLAQQLASSGFRDTSRVGGGNPELGVAIAQHNREQLLSVLSQYRDCLDDMIYQIEHQRWQDIAELLQETQATRPDFLT
ncbi:MAG: prephenate/arogenate dehydrogenase [Jaaginema sp. PMC 1079.18]|nr:prephenate/arogenate dehydrogenase [Jaaginema sp. PMC 1080.18]MEC4852044.1 prephenate/arogenate dehydrogenase [Jaaginema sp. PMC 1079.18]MEC4864650.1 prephenate/arogenate dehydrogenase [Jaaginema sp. PMC 1078.18]